MKIDHIGIATSGLREAGAFWRETLGVEASAVEEIKEQGVRVMMFPVGDSRIELLEATSAASPIARFLEKRGPGIHHIAMRVERIHEVLNQLKTSGARLIDETPRIGADNCLIAFIHPSATGGVLIELVEHPETE